MPPGFVMQSSAHPARASRREGGAGDETTRFGMLPGMLCTHAGETVLDPGFPFQIPFLLWYLSLDMGVWNVGEVIGTKLGLTGMPGLLLTGGTCNCAGSIILY